MLDVLKQINLFFWGGPMMLLLMGTHLYFTFSLHFVQRKVFRGIRLSGQNLTVLTTTLAATLGTGNIIGVGTAVYMGGPGAVFWCWLTGLLGMATTYAEAYLSIQYRDGQTGLGGPMILLQNICKKEKLATLYSICICLSAFCIGGMTQSGAITMTVTSTFHLPRWLAIFIVVVVVGLVLFLGMSAIETFLEKLVPAMGFFFLGGCFLLLFLGSDMLLPSLKAIFQGAFSPSAFGGGILGYTVSHAIRHGIARGLYTNEAGLGTAGIIAAGSTSPNGHSNTHSFKHTPEEGALISMCATFFDTVVLCAITGISLTIFLLRFPNVIPLISSSNLTSIAFQSLPFYGSEILGISTICFALATIIGWSYIGNNAILFLNKKNGVHGYKFLYLLSVLSGGLITFDFIWELTDLINLFLAVPCLYALLTLRKKVH